MQVPLQAAALEGLASPSFAPALSSSSREEETFENIPGQLSSSGQWNMQEGISRCHHSVASSPCQVARLVDRLTCGGSMSASHSADAGTGHTLRGATRNITSAMSYRLCGARSASKQANQPASQHLLKMQSMDYGCGAVALHSCQ